MIYVEAPNKIPEEKLPSIFLAGTITGSQDWQKSIVDQLKGLNLIVYNPRRKNFPMSDPTAAEAQITWEHNMLKAATMISFWFAPETMGPIVLYELGCWSKTQKPLIIGMDPKYSRRQDVEIQTKLVRPDVKIVYSLKDMADGIVLLYNQVTPYL